MSGDLVGYGLEPPNVKWPDDARLTISLVLNDEEGAELCVGDGDPDGGPVRELVYPSMDSRTRDLGIESTFEHGAQGGASRLLRLFDDYGVKAIIYACGRALERKPHHRPRVHHPRPRDGGPRLPVGRSRAVALESFREYCRPLSDVWFARRVDIARWWRAHYAP